MTNKVVLDSETTGLEIAIIGMSGRFPEANNIEKYWQNLQNGVESISVFTDEEVKAVGISSTLLNNPNYVKARAVLENPELFDAPFFGFSPREAEMTDPQHRLFLECAWEALENAGYVSEKYDGLIGVYAGGGWDSYLFYNIHSNSEIIGSTGALSTLIGNEKNFLTTRVSYKLNLEGPSYTVQTACSTSLVAIHLACQSLLSGECDIALAGGVSIILPQKAGYLYEQGGIFSPDGHCRAFDAKAQGTVGGNGMGIVVLKRLADALDDGDSIHAVIKGSAINNDGSFKVSYTAPRIDTQAKVIRAAQVMAEVDPDTISYIETHGTGTALGDPIEIAALTKVFRAYTQKNGFCAIGSVKTNIGHLNTAAGVASLIKTVLALKHKQIPPSLHFEEPNPEIDFANSPFYVNSSLSEWKINGTPRRAGVSSFGIGGTNAHVILEEAPVVEASAPSRPWQLLLLSAKTSTALETATANLVEYLQSYSDLNVADVAYTLQVGRRDFNHRRMVVCQDLDDAVRALSTPDPQRFTHYQEPCNRSVVFMFPGQGAQYVNMALELYQVEPTFREQLDLCCELLKPHLGLDLRHILYPTEEQVAPSQQQLKQTALAQPALFAIEYALANLWMSWGVHPQAMIGHSIGEYVAACLAGVFSLKDALALVAVRGRLMQQCPAGAMLSVPLSEKEIQPWLNQELSLAASNAPCLCVVSGTTEGIDDLQNRLTQQGVECRGLHTSHAFHSPMMEPILEPFQEQFEKVTLNPPNIPFISNVTGTWITATEAITPSYWTRHLRQTVRLAAGMAELTKSSQILLEVGPGHTLSTFARKHQAAEAIALTSLRHPQNQQSDVAFLLNTLGRLWLADVKVDWSYFYAQEQRHRIPLPTYPFERQRYWMEPQNPKDAAQTIPSQGALDKPDIADWFYIPSWKRSMLPQPFNPKVQATQPGCWLVFVDECGLGEKMVQRLVLEGQDVTIVKVGEKFSSFIESLKRVYTINPRHKDDYDTLFQELCALNKLPKTIVHLWSITPNDRTESAIKSLEKSEYLGFYSLLFLAQAIAEQNLTDSLEIGIFSNNMQAVTGLEVLCPEKALILGPCKVIPLEYPNITCHSIDVVIPAETWQEEKLIDHLLAELASKSSDQAIVYRGNHRWVQAFEPVRLDESVVGKPRLREKGVYLITGGLGGVGVALAEYLAQTVQAKLILIGRSAFPDRDEWVGWLSTHDEQDDVSCKIRKLQAIEALGAEVLVISADVSDLEQMSAAIIQANNRFGQIDGVIHAAGVPGGGVIQQKTPEIAESALAPKVRGTLVLDVLFKKTKLDFFVLCSSLNSFKGVPGMVDYTAENTFLDAFAHYSAYRNDRFTISINWDRWNSTGMAVAVEARHKAITGKDVQSGMAYEEGVEAFRRILGSSAVPQVVVSTQDVQIQIKPKDPVKFLQEELAQVSRSKLAHPRPNLGNAYVAPSNEVERTLADIWQQILGIEQVGIYDNFFELGGDSLFVTMLVSRVCSTFQIQLSYKSFFDTPTIAELAQVILQGEVLSKTQINLQSRESNCFPLSFAQQRLWFLNQLEPDQPLYNEFTALHLKGSLNAIALAQSFNEIVQRHETLRTTFTVVDGQPLQVIAPSLTLPLAIANLQELPQTKQEAEVRRIATEEAQRLFNLAEGPLLRFTLLQLGEVEHIVLFTMHHIIADGWSVGILIRELTALYEAFSQGKPSPLPKLSLHYADFAVWQRQWLQGVLESQLSYWKRQLDGVPTLLNLPTDHPQPVVQTYKGARQTLAISKTLTEELKALSRQEGVTLFITLLAAFKTLLHYYTGQDDIPLGSPIANRNRAELENIMGFFVNTLVLRTDLSSNPSFRELLERVREVTLGAYTHQDLPFKKLVEELKPERNLSHNPLFQVWFVLQNVSKPVLEIPGLTITPLEFYSGVARYDLELDVSETPEGLKGVFEYKTNLFDATTIARMARLFEILLHTVVEQPDAKLDTLKQILTEAEKQQQLVKEEDFKNARRQKLGNVRRKAISGISFEKES